MAITVAAQSGSIAGCRWRRSARPIGTWCPTPCSTPHTNSGVDHGVQIWKTRVGLREGTPGKKSATSSATKEAAVSATSLSQARTGG